MTAALNMPPAMDPRALLAECDRAEVAAGGLAAFCKLAWPIVQGEVIWTWHMDLVCAHLEAVSRGECKRLVINIPPGHSKSMLVSVLWPAWHWIHDPGHKWMFTSFDSTLSLRDAAFSKELIQSEWYQERWGAYADPADLKRYGLEPVIVGAETVSLPDKNLNRRKKSSRTDAASQYYTSKNGMRFSTFFGGKATGWHAGTQICDDPLKPRDVQDGGEKARKALEKARITWTQTYDSRRSDPGKFARVVIMQRLHDSDLSQTCIDLGYTLLCLPTKYVPEKHCKTPWGEDPRTERDELLCPQRFTPEVVAEIERSISARDFATQHQQDPTPDGGALFQRKWFERKWDVLPANIQLSMSVDCTFKDTAASDYVVAQVWGRSGGEFYLVDEARGQFDVTNTCLEIEALRRKWPKVRAVLIEDKASGPAVIQILRHRVPGIIPINPEGGKVARANAVEPYFRAGSVILPNEPWIDAWIEEFVRFPMAKFDDRVDAATQYLTHAESKNHHNQLLKAMSNVRKGL